MNREFIDEWEEFSNYEDRVVGEKSCSYCKHRDVAVLDEPCRDCYVRSKWGRDEDNEQKT